MTESKTYGYLTFKIGKESMQERQDYAIREEAGIPAVGEVPSVDSFNRDALEPRLMKEYASDAVGGAADEERGAGSSLRLLMLLLFGLCVLLYAGYLAYGKLARDDGKTPVVKADGSPVREKPLDPGGAFVDHEDKSVYEAMRGRAPEKLPRVLKILPEAETPANVRDMRAAERAAEEAASEEREGAGSVRAEGAVAPSEGTDEGTTVREMPVSEDDVPADERMAATEEEGGEGDADPEKRAEDMERMIERHIYAEEGGHAPAKPVAPVALHGEGKAETETPASSPFTPKKAPASKPKPAVKKPAQTAKAVSSKPKAGEDMPPAASEGRILRRKTTGGYIQLGAFRDMKDAERHFKKAAPYFPSLLQEGRNYYYEPADVKNKGTLYRLKVGPFAGERQARDLCKQFAQRKLECIYVR
jgi:cell division septation protein DedD